MKLPQFMLRDLFWLMLAAGAFTYVGGYTAVVQRSGNPFRGYEATYHRLGELQDMGQWMFYPMHLVDRRVMRPSFWQGSTSNGLLLFH